VGIGVLNLRTVWPVRHLGRITLVDVERRAAAHFVGVPRRSPLCHVHVNVIIWAGSRHTRHQIRRGERPWQHIQGRCGSST
jgi:hypothetical protein